MYSHSGGLRPRTDSPTARPLVVPVAPPPLLPKRKSLLSRRISKDNRRAVLLSSLAVALAFLLSGVIFSLLNADEPDVIKHEEKLSLSDWKAVLEKKAKQSAPPHEALGLFQIAFVSCNRHDRSQAYWGYVAAAAQCEMVPTDVRAKSPPCRRLYAGRSPIITTTQRGRGKQSVHPHDAPVSSANVVPLGGCGTVVDSANALRYRNETKKVSWQATMQAAWRLLRRNQIFYPAAHVTAGQKGPSETLPPPPLDALVWLGDAIYADKPANRQPSQGFGHVENSLAVVKKMWETQRDSPIYDAFRESCLWREGAVLPTATVQNEEANLFQWVYDAVAEVGNRIASVLEAVDDAERNDDAEHELGANVTGAKIELFDDDDITPGDKDGAARDEAEEEKIQQKENQTADLAEDEDKQGNDDGADGPNDDEEDDIPDVEDPDFAVDLVREVFGGIIGDEDELEDDLEDEMADLGFFRRQIRGPEGAAEDGVDEQLANLNDGEDTIEDEDDGEENEHTQDPLKEKASKNPPTDDAEERTTLLRPSSFGSRPNVFGTWDDHDMGKNDGGKEYPFKNVTQRYFLDFLQAPPADPRWSREGVYAFHPMSFHDVFMGDTLNTSAVFGGSAMDDNRLVKMRAAVVASLAEVYRHAACLILLDVRTFRDSPSAARNGDMLGEEQWRWLEERIVKDIQGTVNGREQCALTLVGSGIQLIADEKTAENWAAFPRSRDRLFGLFKAHKIERVAFLTGDVHMGELAADFTRRTIDYVMGYPIVEATSSGLTHSAAVFPGVPTLLRAMFASPERRIGRLYIEKNFGTVRLSLDGARAMEQLDPIVTALNEIRAANKNANGVDEAKARHRLRSLVNSVVNATFTVYSIPKKGKPVLRLNFPLSMLSYESSPRYIDATVVPQRGYVYRSIASGPVQDVSVSESAKPLPASEMTEIRTYYPDGMRTVSHYPDNAAPLFTAYIRWMQSHLFTNSSISETIGSLIKIHIFIGFVIVVAVAAFFWHRLRRWWLARKVRKGVYPASPKSSNLASSTTHDEGTTAVAIANFVMRRGEKQKEG